MLRARAGGRRKFFQVTPKASPLEMPMRRHSEGAGFWLLSQRDSKSLIWLVELVLCGPLKSNMGVWGGIPPQ